MRVMELMKRRCRRVLERAAALTVTEKTVTIFIVFYKVLHLLLGCLCKRRECFLLLPHMYYTRIAASLKVLGNDCGHRTLPESLEAQGSEGLRVKVAKAIWTMELAGTVPAATTKVGRVASVAEGT